MTANAYLMLVIAVFLGFAGVLAYTDFIGRDLRRKHEETIRAAVSPGSTAH